MAPSTRRFSILFLIVLFISLHQSQARDSQLFSKVTTSNANNNDHNNNGKETVVVPAKEQPLTNEDQQPNFIPDNQNGYGLYGHEPDHFSPTTAATNLPFKTESGEPTTTTTTNNNNYYYNKDAYVTQPQGMSDTRFMGSGYTTANNYYNKDAPQGMSDTRFMGRGYTTTGAAANNHYNGGNNHNTQQQGMSDTRFLENGKYYYDIKSENNYPNKYGNSRGVEYNNKGYYGNYNENSYEQNSSMEGYQNQDEFQESEEEYVP